MAMFLMFILVTPTDEVNIYRSVIIIAENRPIMKLMKKMFLRLVLALFFVFSPIISNADNWYYPMTNYGQRTSVKQFGQKIDDSFYKGKESLFPFNHFYGYHAADDLEYTVSEKEEKTPFYAVTTGKIVYIGSLDGYGGVILEQIGDGHTALYGHVKISDLTFKTGDTVQGGTALSYLGDAFSSETSRERKHLHFGIYKGSDLYFHGHESTEKVLNRRWVDPTEFLKQHGAMNPGVSPQVTAMPPAQTQQKSSQSLFNKIFVFFVKLIKFRVNNN